MTDDELVPEIAHRGKNVTDDEAELGRLIAAAMTQFAQADGCTCEPEILIEFDTPHVEIRHDNSCPLLQRIRANQS